MVSLSQKKGVIPFELVITDSLLTEENASFYLGQLDSLITVDSTNAGYYDYRGVLHFKLNNIKSAYYDYSKAISLQPNDPEFHLHRGLLLFSLKEPDEAINNYNKAVLLAKGQDTVLVQALVARGNARAMKRDFQGAYEDYFHGLNIDSNSVASMSGLGIVLDDLGKEDEAINYLEKALSLSPDDIIVLTNLGYRYMMKENYTKALKWYDKALELNSDAALPLNNRGYTKYKLGRFREALVDVNKSLNFFPQNAFAFKNRALIYIALKQEEKACADISQALQFGFTEEFGDEVEKLKQKYCIKQL